MFLGHGKSFNLQDANCDNEKNLEFYVIFWLFLHLMVKIKNSKSWKK